MKFFIKLTTLLFLATISCPCELTGHRFCDHKDHPKFTQREDVRTYRLSKSTFETKDSIENVLIK